jgi:predicted RNase H-like HicB family nuclease
MSMPYSMVIQWSDEDQVYVVSLPEFGPYAHTHGATYEEAARMGQEVLELLVESAQEDGEPLPEPSKYDAKATASKTD